MTRNKFLILLVALVGVGALMLFRPGRPGPVSASPSPSAAQIQPERESTQAAATVKKEIGTESGALVGAGRLWGAPIATSGQPLNPNAASVAGLASGGLTVGLTTIFDGAHVSALKSLAQGQTLTIPLPGGRDILGRVNLVQVDVQGNVRVGGGLTGGAVGSFSLGQNAQGMSGRVLLRQEKLAYLVSTVSSGRVEVRQVAMSEVVCYPLPRDRLAGLAAALPGSGPLAAAVPELRSRPGATAVLYLDFDGASVTDPDWNDGNTITAAESTLTSGQITEVWNRVKEDFAPFKINITTLESDYTNAAVGSRMRVIITPTDAWYPDAGGVAYLDTFSRAGSNGFTSDIPGWVFNTSVTGVAEAISHEAGHTLGLQHDRDTHFATGTEDYEYYSGHGGTGPVSWGAIMGAAYTRTVVQWSKGEYPSANNFEDDVAIIAGAQTTPLSGATNNTGYVEDEAGDSRGSAAALGISVGTIGQSGVISSASDVDYYAFTVSGTQAVTVNATPVNSYARQPNLDISLELQDGNGNVLASSNPDTDLAASLTANIGAGTYYMKIQGAGRAGDSAVGDYGYSNYGSIGSYTITGTVATNVAGAPSITNHPVNQVVNIGQTTNFSVAATGNPAPSYQWQRLPTSSGTWSNLSNGSPYSRVTTATMSVTASLIMNGDQFRCLVSNSAGAVTSNAATLTLIVAPVVTSQPTNQSVAQGSAATFTAAATGSPAPTYQWRKNNVDIPGATSASYTIASVAPSDEGNYRVAVTNAWGSITSDEAALEVIGPGPTVTSLSSTRQVLAPGQTMTLSVSATGAGALAYQWVHNGQSIAGATGSSFTKAGLGRIDAGWYVVLITDSNGTRRSAPIFVAVVPAQTQVRAWGTNTDGVLAIPAGLTTATAVSAGGNFALALKSDGTVVSWGSNAQGQGIVPAGLTGVVAVSAGYGHALALKSDGSITAWGGGGFSALANIPVGLKNVVAIAAANAHSLALRSDGTVAGWGQSISGEAVPPAGLTGVVAIAAGFEFSVALKSDGTVVAWGDSSYGKTGVPAGLSGVMAIAAGDAGHTLALRSDGTVVAWGRSNEGQTDVPVGLNHVVMIAAGERHSVALKDDGTVVMWGNVTSVPSDLTGVLGVSAGFGFSMGFCDGSSESAPTITTQPINMVGVETSVASLSVAAAGSAPLNYQWRKGGSNILGATAATLTLSDLAIGDAGNYDVVVSNYLGSVTSTTATLTVKAIPVVTALSSGWQVVQPGQALNLSVAATGTGTIGYQWMHNGQPIAGATSSSLSVPSVTAQAGGWYLVFISDANGTRRSLPIRVLVAPASTQVRIWGTNNWINTVPAGLTGVLAIASGRDFALALRQTKTVVAWGNNVIGQTNVPAGLSGIEAVSAGNGYALAMKNDGTVVGWGSNNYGAQLVPADLSGVVDVSAGDSHAVALKSNGRVVAWGSNNYNQTKIPSGLKNVFALSAGSFHTLAIKDDGTVVVWGDNGSGQLQVPAGLNNVVAVAGGYAHSLALKSDGTVVAWGSNSYGETTVPAGLNGVIAIAAARYHSLALKADGTVIAWGSTSDGNAAPPADLAGVYAIADGTGFSLALRDATGEAAPTITTQPASQSLAQGQRATFSVAANGAGTFGYQWRKNGVNIAGATSASFIIAELANADAGNYDVVVSNYVGSVTSALAVLTVNPPAVITSLSPTRQVLSPGQSMNLSVTATGVGALSYQWTHNGRSIVGATDSTYTLTGVGLPDSGWYLVYVTDSNGTKRSAPIFVSVAPLVTEIKAWGSNGYHELAIPSGLKDAVAIAAGSVTALALKRDGTVVAWGDNWTGSGNTTFPAGLNNIVAIAAGSSHGLALKSDGTVVSWGWYNSGYNPPPAGLNNVVAIAASEQRSMALKSDGTVVTWGASATPPAGLADILAVTTGQDHLYALKDDGTIVGWGGNFDGQLSTPAGLSGVVAISAGQDHTVALKSNGTVVAWGQDNYGSQTTVVPAGLSGVVAIEAGSHHSLALKGDGTVTGWGEDSAGQATSPAGLSKVFAVSAGAWFSLALRDGTADDLPVITTQPISLTLAETGTATFSVSATGPGTFSYQWRKSFAPIAGATSATLILPDLPISAAGNYDVVVTNHVGSTTSAIATLTVNPIPVVNAMSPTRQVMNLGQTINLSVNATGTGSLSYQWFRNHRPIVGATSSAFTRPGSGYQDGGSYFVRVTDNYGTRISAPMFVIVAPAFTEVIGWGSSSGDATTVPAGLTTAVAVATSYSSSFAIKADGTVVSWGQGTWGGNIAPSGLANVAAIAASYWGGIVLKGDGTVTTWSQFWDASDAPPVGLNNVCAVSAGDGHFLALKSDGKVVAWGDNNYGQCNVPAGLADVVSIVADNRLSFATKSDGTLVVWGDSSNGRTALPAGLADTVTAGANHHNAFAVKSDGTIVAWGNYNYGQPHVPADLADVTALATGDYFTLALISNGTVAAWGVDVYGETVVPAGLAGVFGIAAGDRHSLAIRDKGGVSAPTIDTQPQGQVVTAGATSQFTVVSTGAPPPTYQWQRLPAGGGTWSDVANGGNYSGATSSTLSVSNTTLSMSGDQFRCVATNASGNATSNAAILTINPSASSPMLVTMTGTVDYISDSGYYLPAKGVQLGVPFTISAVYDFAITPVTGLAGTLVYTYPTSATISLNGLVYTLPGFRVTAVDNLVYNSYGFSRVDGHTIQGTTAASAELNALQLTSILYSLNPDLVNISASNKLQFAQPGDYNYIRFFRLQGTDRVNPYPHNSFEVSGDISSISVVPLAAVSVAPSITAQPASQSLMAGQTAQFVVSATGLPAPPLQWQRLPSGSGTWVNLSDGGTYSGVNSNKLTVGSIALAMGGDQFRCVATNASGSVTSNSATLTITVPLPVITVPPTGQATLAGTSITLDVGVTSPVAVTYQWQKGGVNIPGATSATYNIASFGAGDVGSYTVVVSNSAGSVTSTAASLAIALPPVINTQPQTQTIALGNPVTFSVGVTSNATLSYVWRKNGTPIPGATAATYMISAVQAADAAYYSVVVSNVAGNEISSPATLTVQLPPAITQQPANQQILSGTAASFTVIVATSTTSLSYQWQRLPAGSGTWANVAGAGYTGATTATLTASSQALGNSGDQFRCVITNVAGSVTSNAATLSVAAAGFAKISAGRYHSLRVDIFAGFYVTGTNLYGQLGTGNATTRSTPAQVTLSGQTITDAAAGAQHSLILTAAKELWATGFNDNGQLGDGTVVAKSTSIKVATNVAGMAAAVFHSAYIKTDGTLWTVGGNDSGQLGNGTVTDSTTATQVATNVVDVALGNRQSFFIKSDGTLWGMGDMNGSGTPVSTPVQIATNVAAVAAGAYHSLILKTDGTLWAMGYNPFGQLGTGDTTDRLTPVQVATGVKAVSAGYFFSVFLKTDGTLWATGRNDFGQLGDGTNTNRSTAVQLASNVFSVSASESYTLFTKTDGSLWATGLGGNGQFGNGGTTTVSTPVLVSTGTILAPAAPSSLVASPVATLDRVHLVWQPAADARTYEVWRNTVNDSSSATRLAPGLRWAIYQDLTAASGQTYYYWIKSVDQAGASAFSAPALGSSSNAIAPSITTPPTTQTVNVGDSVTFTVVASGSAPFTYQWRKGGTDIPGALAVSYTIASVAAADAGSYDVVVTNSAGNTTSTAATLTVNALAQTIIFNAPADRAYTTTPFTLSATASSSLAVTFTILSGPATLAGNDVTLTGVGTVTVRAAQDGNATYAAAANVDRIFTVSQATASVTLGGLGATYNGAPQGASATTSPTGLTVNFTYDGAATVPTNAGSYAVVGTISDANYTGSASGTLVIAKADQTISFTGPADQPYSATPLTLSATATSGLTVTFSVNSGPATVNGTNLTLTGSGPVSVRATQVGDDNRNAAPHVDRSFTVAGNFASWKLAKFTADELLNHPELTGPNAVYGSDGLSNLVKYALGLEPKQDITTGLPDVSTTATDWVYSYTRPIDTTDLTYDVEMSTNLTTWTTAGVAHELVSTGAGTATWQAKYPLASAANVYFRLRITAP